MRFPSGRIPRRSRAFRFRDDDSRDFNRHGIFPACTRRKKLLPPRVSPVPYGNETFCNFADSFSFRGQPEHLPDDDPLVCFVIEGAVRGGNRCITENLGLKTAFPRQERALSSTRKPCGHTPGHRQFVARVQQFCRPPVTTCRSGKTKHGLPFRAMPLPFSPRKGTVSRHHRSRKTAPTASRKRQTRTKF